MQAAPEHNHVNWPEQHQQQCLRRQTNMSMHACMLAPAVLLYVAMVVAVAAVVVTALHLEICLERWCTSNLCAAAAVLAVATAAAAGCRRTLRGKPNVPLFLLMAMVLQADRGAPVSC